ncbi:RNA polymerase sigma factor [Paenibacillus sp. GCM10027626]|uniref:RNA polymerase sigma factor n=1 Tax=Paenibacillus sp. GCM10027626 TaxID=3273411 RepID=UPI00363B4235
MKDWTFLFYQDFDALTPQMQELAYRSFYTLVYTDILYLLHDHSLTEDIIQEAFLKITSIIRKHKISNYSAWMRQVTRNMAIDYLKKVNKNQQIISLNDVHRIQRNLETSTEQTNVAKEVEKKIRDELLHQSILELSPGQRTIINLFYIEDMSYKEIAATLDLSEQAVSQKLARARKKLLKNFRRKWADSYEQ